MDERLGNFRGAYHELADRVRIALLTQTGNAAVLEHLRDLVLRLASTAENVCSDLTSIISLLR
jgi:hypothetical protein